MVNTQILSTVDERELSVIYLFYIMDLKFLSWQEGKYSDLWFLVHFSSGVTAGTLFLLIGMSEPLMWLTCGVATVSWEIFEWRHKIPESMQNRIMDIGAAFAGASIGYKYLLSLNFDQISNYQIFFAEAVGLIFLSVLGWKNYRFDRREQ
jgi:hypothetical protein